MTTEKRPYKTDAFLWLRVTEDIRMALLEDETPCALKAAVILIETGRAYRSS